MGSFYYPMISDVTITDLDRHFDERQMFTEVFKNHNIRQVSHCVMHKGVTKLRHYHLSQTDWWHVILGELVLHLYDNRPHSGTHGLSMDITLNPKTSRVVGIPPGVVHGCTVTEGPCHLLYATNRLYDPTDEYRIP